MTVETIFVGTEILLGNIVNTNGAYLAGRFAGLGLSTYYQTVVGDNLERICEAVRQSISRSDIVILCGGLGPTQDDITRDGVAKALGLNLVTDEHSKKRIEEYFARSGKTMTENNYRQALIPEGGKAIDNECGTAPGIVIEKDGKTVILLPGPPVELKAMFEKDIVPLLSEKTDGVIYSATVKVCGKSESEIATILDDLINGDGEVTVAPYAKCCEVHLRVTAKAEDEKTAKKLVKPVVKEIKSRLEEAVYTTDDDTTLEKAVVDLLLANGLTVTTVESCTGGLLAGRLINVPGVSEVFKSGHITYSNKAKRKLVSVKKTTLDKYGAVSAKVVKEMARGATMFNHADVAVAVSGIAGPDGGTEEKPVGLVYIGCSVCGEITTAEYHFTGTREKIRECAVAEGLILMRRCILEYYSRVTFGEK